MKQSYFSPVIKPEDGSRITDEFRNIYKWLNSNFNTFLAVLTTTGATVTDIASVYLLEGDVVYVEAQVVAAETDQSNRALYHRAGLFYRATAGNVTQQGSTTALATIESDADWDLTLNADTTAQATDVRVTGKVATVINWKAIIKYMKVS